MTDISLSGLMFEAAVAQPDRSGASLHDQGYAVIKRALDILGAGLGLLLLTPLFLLVSVAIRLDSRGPVLFSQTRVGENGREFRCWKFRSMYVDAEARKAQLMASNEMQGGTTFKMRKDPRITRVGRFIRKASIDELPQLWNVLKGDMSHRFFS